MNVHKPPGIKVRPISREPDSRDYLEQPFSDARRRFRCADGGNTCVRRLRRNAVCRTGNSSTPFCVAYAEYRAGNRGAGEYSASDHNPGTGPEWKRAINCRGKFCSEEGQRCACAAAQRRGWSDNCIFGSPRTAAGPTICFAHNPTANSVANELLATQSCPAPSAAAGRSAAKPYADANVTQSRPGFRCDCAAAHTKDDKRAVHASRGHSGSSCRSPIHSKFLHSLHNFEQRAFNPVRG